MRNGAPARNPATRHQPSECDSKKNSGDSQSRTVEERGKSDPAAIQLVTQLAPFLMDMRSDGQASGQRSVVGTRYIGTVASVCAVYDVVGCVSRGGRRGNIRARCHSTVDLNREALPDSLIAKDPDNPAGEEQRRHPSTVERSFLRQVQFSPSPTRLFGIPAAILDVHNERGRANCTRNARRTHAAVDKAAQSGLINQFQWGTSNGAWAKTRAA